MLTSLTIEGYRGFKKFTLNGLGRVNLLVGTNNSGKTAILEAIQILTSSADLEITLKSISLRRNELLLNVLENKTELEIGRFSNGHKIADGSILFIRALNDSTTIRSSIGFQISQGLANLDFHVEKLEDRPGLVQRKGDRLCYTISKYGGLAPKIFSNQNFEVDDSAVFVASNSITFDFLRIMWNRIALRPEEDYVLDALRLIEPDVVGIRVFEGNRGPDSGSMGGVNLKLRNSDVPVPIGSFGEGMWKLLGLMTALVSAKSDWAAKLYHDKNTFPCGILLVDDIDTGLHYTVMEKMWKMVSETAEKLNVQVFATTHSMDCVASLAAICQDKPDNKNASIHRINPKYDKSTSFTEQEIIQVAENRMDIR